MKLGINEMAKAAFKTAKSKGFHPKKDKMPGVERILARLALIHSEVSEALEDVRKGAMEEKEKEGTKILGNEIGIGIGKPIGFPSELADIVIRVGDLAAETGADLEGAIRRKMAYNKTRGWKHFKKI